MEMYERICLVRKTLKMNQGAFASAIGFAQSTIAMIEVGKREISDRHIKAICSQFQINEDWLRTGEGSMFVQTKDDYINQLAQRYKGSDLLKKVIEAFISLNDEERKAVLKFIDNLDPEPTESILSGSNLKLNELENVPSYARSQDDTTPAGKQIPKSEIKAALAERAKDDDDL